MSSRIVFIFIALVITLGLLSCTTTTPPPTPAPTPAPQSEPASGPTADNPINLKFSYHGPPETSLVKAIQKPWTDAIEEATGGRVIITHYPGETLVSAQDAYDAVVSGLCDIALIDTEENPGRFPLTGINSLPFMYPNTEIAGVVSHELLNKYCVDTELEEVKLLITAPLHNSHYLGNHPVETMADFGGLKIRSSGKIEASTLDALGATTVQIGTEDLFSALDRGTVDGCFFTWAGSLAFGLKDVTKYRTESNVFPRVFLMAMNPKIFSDMPSDIQQIINDHCTPQTSLLYARAHEELQAGVKGAIIGSDSKAGNPPIYTLSEEEREVWKEACTEVWDKWLADTEAKGLPGEAMLEEALNLVNKYS